MLTFTLVLHGFSRAGTIGEPTKFKRADAPPAHATTHPATQISCDSINAVALNVQGIIEPARWQIEQEHHPQIRDLAFVVVDNPFVPPGREGIFARGLQSGFSGNWLIATHLLVPQIENSIRYVLTQRGVITSKLNSELIQEVRQLDTLLKLPETIETFGANTVFDLRGLSVEKFGCNLRNRLTHGLMHEGHFYSTEAIYIWWLVLRLCCVPLILHERQIAAGPSKQKES